jgi:adenylate cyclase
MSDPVSTEEWRQILMGEMRGLRTFQSLWRTKHPGGAEVEISAMFADVRGSTGLAEQRPPGEFGQLLTRFWGAAARVVDRWDGIVDKFVGDEAVALFIPGFAGEDHAARAVKAARELLMETGHGNSEPWIPVGIGVHTASPTSAT